jgi:hypothetical protein
MLKVDRGLSVISPFKTMSATSNEKPGGMGNMGRKEGYKGAWRKIKGMK